MMSYVGSNVGSFTVDDTMVTKLGHDTHRFALSIRFHTRLEKTSSSVQCVAKCSYYTM